jgi:hypothetical protein
MNSIQIASNPRMQGIFRNIISFKSADYFDVRLADHSIKSYVSSLFFVVEKWLNVATL